MKFIIAIAVVLFFVAPLLTIWALNTLFPVLAIPYSVETWAAVAILAGIFRANVTAVK